MTRSVIRIGVGKSGLRRRRQNVGLRILSHRQTSMIRSRGGSAGGGVGAVDSRGRSAAFIVVDSRGATRARILTRKRSDRYGGFRGRSHANAFGTGQREERAITAVRDRTDETRVRALRGIHPRNTCGASAGGPSRLARRRSSVNARSFTERGMRMDRELYSIEEACRLMGGIAKNTLYRLLRSGALASVPIGRRRFIAAEAIATFVANSPTMRGLAGTPGSGTPPNASRHR